MIDFADQVGHWLSQTLASHEARVSQSATQSQQVPGPFVGKRKEEQERGDRWPIAYRLEKFIVRAPGVGRPVELTTWTAVW